MRNKIALFVLALVASLTLTSCGGNNQHAIYMVVDTSGTYAKQAKKAGNVLKWLLLDANPGDTLALAKITSRSYSEKNIVAKITLDSVPSRANDQKDGFASKIDSFVRKTLRGGGSAYTDISGAIILATEFLQETGAGRKTIVIFSDMQQELGKGIKRNFKFEVNGIRFVVINDIKLRSDNIDPRRYKARMDAWEKKLMEGGATEWLVITDMDKVAAAFGG